MLHLPIIFTESVSSKNTSCASDFRSLGVLTYLRSEICNVRLFLLQGSLGDKHGEVAVLYAQLLNFPVKEVFNCLPDGVGPRPQHVAAAHIVILDHLCLGDDLNGQPKKKKTIILNILDFYSSRLKVMWSENDSPESTNLQGFPLSWLPNPT